MAELKLIYEDEDILICHKAAGMATEGARAGQMDVISAVRNYLARKNRDNDKGRQSNLPPYVATVNRLDKPVEGVLVLAKNKKAASSLALQIKEKTAGKYYYALVYGIPDLNMDTISDFISRREDNKKAIVLTEKEASSFEDDAVILESGEKVRTIGGEPKEAILEYLIVGRSKESALLQIKLHTGRFHQIRAQLAKRGYPILGDPDYGTEESMAYSRERGIKYVCLAAYKYEIRHPSTGKDMSFKIRPDNPAIAELLT